MLNTIIGLTLLSTLQLWAHGEDKPGPHGGFITMPGPFHVELVMTGNHTLNAYLLDMDWKNPILKDSAVAITHGKTQATCKKEEKTKNFVCEFPKKINLNKKGTLAVESTRDNQAGMKVTYELPLKLKMNH